MRRRLYFLVPDVVHAKSIVNELLLMRVNDDHIALIAKEGTELDDLPEASLLEKTDFIPALERSALIGGGTGMLAGLVAVSVPAISAVVAGWAVLLATTMAGAGVGAFAGTLISVDVPNSRLERFHDEIAKGKLLMLVDVPAERVDEITDAIKKHHPEAEVEGVEPTVPPFP